MPYDDNQGLSSTDDFDVRESEVEEEDPDAELGELDMGDETSEDDPYGADPEDEMDMTLHSMDPYELNREYNF